MKYLLLHNLSGFDPFKLGDTLSDGFRGEIDAEDALTMSSVCESIFARHNRDDRPDGKTAPSLSVGDVIHFPLIAHTFAVERIGFRRVESYDVYCSRTYRSYLESLDIARQSD
jgi:hypothetical protein